MMLSSNSILLANGILNDSESVHGWTDKGEDFFEFRGIRCKRYECETTWTFRKLPWHDRKYVEAIRVISKTTSQPIKHAAFHSFASDFGLRGILASETPYHTIVLIQGAAHADCDRNGINDLLRKHLVQRVIVTSSKADCILTKARYWPPFARVPRPLGVHGPENVAEGFRVDHVHWDNFNHSTMWMKHHIQNTLGWIHAVTIHGRHSTIPMVNLGAEATALPRAISTNPDDHTRFDHE